MPLFCPFMVLQGLGWKEVELTWSQGDGRVALK